MSNLKDLSLLKYLKSRSATTKDHEDMKQKALSEFLKNSLVENIKF